MRPMEMICNPFFLALFFYAISYAYSGKYNTCYTPKIIHQLRIKRFKCNIFCCIITLVYFQLVLISITSMITLGISLVIVFVSMMSVLKMAVVYAKIGVQNPTANPQVIIYTSYAFRNLTNDHVFQIILKINLPSSRRSRWKR